MVTVYTVVCFFDYSRQCFLFQLSLKKKNKKKNLRKTSDAMVFCVASLSFMFCKYWRSFDQFDLEMECNFAYKIAIKLLLKVF